MLRTNGLVPDECQKPVRVITNLRTAKARGLAVSSDTARPRRRGIEQVLPLYITRCAYGSLGPKATGTHSSKISGRYWWKSGRRWRHGLD
jgi:hypothetical protein